MPKRASDVVPREWNERPKFWDPVLGKLTYDINGQTRVYMHCPKPDCDEVWVVGQWVTYWSVPERKDAKMTHKLAILVTCEKGGHERQIVLRGGAHMLSK